MKQSSKVYRLWVVLLFIVIIVSAEAPVVAQKTFRVRGRIERMGDSGKKYPATYTRVTIKARASKRWMLGVYTGSDGMFYFYVEPGDYSLQILGSDSKPIATYYLQVKKTNVDLAPILLP